jgi:phage gp29-like protein
VAYLFKTLPLRDWLSYSEKFGMPGLLGKTDATLDSPEWNAFAEAMQSFASDWAAICSTTNDIQLIESHNRGAQPFEPLVARMDEEMTRLWRGSDLATASKAHGTGASLQADEAETLEADDAQMLSETLTAQVSRLVLRYFFGDAPQLAYLKIHSAEQKATAEDLKVDDFLLRAGFPISRESAAERYDRPIPETSAELLTAPKTPALTPAANEESNLNNQLTQ